MKQTFNMKEKLKTFIYILGPILITQITMNLMSFFDVIMTGRFSSAHLAGIAIGTSFWIPLFTGLNGLFSAITPIVAQLVGSKNTKEIPSYIYQGLFIGIKLTIVIVVFGYFFLEPILNRMGLESEVAYVAKYYLVGLSFGIFAALFYHVLRAFIDGLGKTRVSMAVMLLSLPINISLNYILIYGKLGFPALGGVGAGIATGATYWIIMLISLWFTIRWQPFRLFRLFRSLPTFHYQKWKEIIIIGTPIGLSIFMEISIFSAVTLFMSEFGTAVIAGHQAAMSVANLLYMIPMSFAMALTILVGFEVGARRLKDARAYSYLGIGFGLGLIFVISVFVFIFREPIATIYSEDPEVITLTIQFLLFALFFQISDAFQAPIQGILRGYKDVNVAMMVSLASYWLIGLPVGFLLAKFTGMGPFGYWLGLIIGLALGAVMLTFRLFFIQRRKYNEREEEEVLLKAHNI
ncbi:MAG TPA: MATE family efflux transporter [Pseudogracilibacillus sp.]|nr:MATE family efflux transporter [Pseudogracilibacillus sp.]